MASLPTISTAPPPSTSTYMKSLSKRIPPDDPQRFCAFIATLTEYKHINPLPIAIQQDGIDLEQVLTNPSIGQYFNDNVTRIDTPTKKQFQKKFKLFQKRCRKVRKKTKGRVTVLIYLAGHTGKIKGGRRKGDYLLMKECKPTTSKKLSQGAMNIKDIMRNVMKLTPKNVLFVVHSNHGTTLLQGIKGIDITLDSEGRRDGGGVVGGMLWVFFASFLPSGWVVRWNTLQCFLLPVPTPCCFLFLVSCFLFLVSCFLFVPWFLFLFFFFPSSFHTN